MKKCNLILTVATTLFLAGCLVPERFSATVDVQPDTSYMFHYSGTVVHALAAAQIRKTGSLSEKEQTGLKAEAEKLAKNADVRKVVYKGDGRYELVIETTKKAGQPMHMLDIFSVRTDKDGVMTIASKEINEKGKRELAQLGITIDGTLEVRIPKNAEIISHNATSTPTLGFGSYSWKVGRIDQQATMKLRLKP